MKKPSSGIKQYMWELGGAILLYATLLSMSNSVLAAGIVDSAGGRIAVALTPMLACALALRAILCHIRRLDELGRRIQLEALAFAFAASAMLTFSYGFLEGQGLPKLSLFAVLPLMAALWGLGMAVFSWRYR